MLKLCFECKNFVTYVRVGVPIKDCSKRMEANTACLGFRRKNDIGSSWYSKQQSR